MRKNVIEVNEISESTKASFRTRVISAVVATAIVLPAVFLGDWFYFALITFVAIVATVEIIKCAKPKHSIWLTIITAVLILLLTAWPIFRQIINSTIDSTGWKLWTSFESVYLSILILVIAFMTIFFFVVIDSKTTVGHASFIFTIGVITALGLQCLLFLRYYPIVDYYDWKPGIALPNVSYFNFYENFESSILLIYIAICTFTTDIGAYITGILFGKHKMNERISPKKTWEGFVGGIVMSFIVSFIFGLVLALNGHPILTIFDKNHWYNILILSMIIPFFATLGDFVFSSFKRYYGIKDFGNIMPGHGGVLDRIDSIIFAVIVASIFICIVSGREVPLL